VTYDARAYPAVAVTVDVVVLTVRDDALHVLLVTRGEPPFEGRPALPGGFIRPDEDLDGAAARELAEETRLRASSRPRSPVHLEQLGSYGAPDRDPRMRVVSVAYLALAPALPLPVGGGDAAAAGWAPAGLLLGGPGRLAFDHGRILRDAVERARAKLEYTGLAAAFCGEEFTVAELRRVYEIVWGTALDPRNFHRKVTGASGFLVPTTTTTTRGGGRPAQLFRRGPATLLNPPILRG
jgi:8-oxo-dGTP diphosphatase